MTTPTKSRCDACGAAYNGCPLHKAAPALLAACEEALGGLDRYLSAIGPGYPSYRDLDAVYRTLCAALKLAKGE